MGLNFPARRQRTLALAIGKRQARPSSVSVFPAPKPRMFPQAACSILAAPVALTKLILASASPRRAEILREAGFTFVVMSSAVDETPVPGESAQDLVQRLADAKAELVAARAVGPAIVIAADTAVLIEGEILGKPRTTDDARHMLTRLSGRVHSVITGVTAIRLPDAERRSFVETTHVHFAPLSPEQLTGYLATEEPFDKAGAYAIQGRAGRFIPRIEGCYYNVVGLPLARLFYSLSELGWSED
jgi:septum formation protein